MANCINKIRIINKSDQKIREYGNYESHYFKCGIAARNYSNENGEKNLELYECYYTLKKCDGISKIENPKFDIHTELTCTVPEEWDICMVTEVYPKEEGDMIKATFNVYKQTHIFGNKRYFAQADIIINK